MLVGLEEVCRTIGLVLGRRNVAADQRLIEDLRAESADILNIMVTVEQKFGVRIEEKEMTEVATARDLHGLLSKITNGTRDPDPARSA